MFISYVLQPFSRSLSSLPALAEVEGWSEEMCLPFPDCFLVRFFAVIAYSCSLYTAAHNCIFADVLSRYHNDELHVLWIGFMRDVFGAF